MRLLVQAEFFPSRIQPWLLNTTEEAIRRGADVEVVAIKASGTSFPPRVRQLGLLEKTLHLPTHGRDAVVSGLRQFLPWQRHFFRAWRGLARLASSRAILTSTPIEIVHAVLHSSLVGGARYDLVHAHYLATAFDYLEVRKVFHCPLVVTFHGMSPEGVGMLPPERNKLVFEAGTMFLLNTKFAQRQLESLGCPPEKIRILPQGLRLDEYEFRPRAYPADGRVVILTVARFHRDKGHEYAIRAVAQLVALGKELEYRLVGVGPERAKLEALVAELGLRDRVRFLGQLNDEELRREYATAHIFILPSIRDEVGHHEETQGAVIQEAQASGAIVISTRTGGIPECVDDGRSAFLVPDRDADAMANIIFEVISSPDQWDEWQRAGRAWVEAHFDTAVLGDKLWALYQEALQA